MFDSVNNKLRAAQYFLEQLGELEKMAGDLAAIAPFLMRVNLDGFFFEIISAKDFFLQEINDNYGGGLTGNDATKLNKLLASPLTQNAKDQVRKIQRLISRKDTWLWRLNNYRNSATHRTLIGKHINAQLPARTVKVYLFLDPDESSKGHLNIEIMPYCEGALKQMTQFLEELYSQL